MSDCVPRRALATAVGAGHLDLRARRVDVTATQNAGGRVASAVALAELFVELQVERACAQKAGSMSGRGRALALVHKKRAAVFACVAAPVADRKCAQKAAFRLAGTGLGARGCDKL